MNDPTKELIPRSAIEYCLRKETVSTNPDEYESHEKFIAFMDDPEISEFGKWMHSNGFNCALTAVKCDLDKIPAAQPERLTQERKKGQWVGHKDYPGLAYLCSECDHFTTVKSNYCPNCGADMRGEQNG